MQHHDREAVRVAAFLDVEAVPVAHVERMGGVGLLPRIEGGVRREAGVSERPASVKRGSIV